MSFSDRRKRRPSQARSKFERWVLEYGGTTKLADDLGASPTTVRNWTARRATPALEFVREMIRKAKGTLSLEDIYQGTKPE